MLLAAEQILQQRARPATFAGALVLTGSSPVVLVIVTIGVLDAALSID